MKKVLMLALATVLLATSAAVQAQNPNPPQGPPSPHGGMMGFGPIHPGFWKDSEIVTKLNLTDAQRTQLEKIFTDQRDSFRTTHQQMKVAMDAVRESLDAPQVDEAAYNANVTKLLALHAQIAQQFAALTLAFRKVLTADQWKALEQMEMQHKHEFGQHPGKHGGQDQPQQPQ